MRLVRTVLVTSVFWLPLVHTIACGSDPPPPDTDPFDTFQLCFDDHHGGGFTVNDAIKICCIDHPIGVPPVAANVVCGESPTACQTYVNAELTDTSATMAEIITACDEYIVDRAK
jgi:hypothetical protein